MTTLGVSGIMFQCVFDGSLSMHTEIERRPYHKNCNCALHTSKRGACTNSCPQQGNISFPKKQSRTDGSLCMSISNSAATSKSSALPSNASMSIGNIEGLNGVHS